MIIPKEFRLKYDLLHPHYKEAKIYIDQTILNYSLENHFAYSSRIKAVESVSEKIEGGRYKDWNSIDDFIAAVIIIPNISYEADVIKFLEKTFIKVNLKKRGTSLKSPEVFRFDATRFIGKIHPIDEEQEIHKINFEVQIRSAFEHAWSVATHDLSYKSSTIDWKMLRLASQLKSSVEQLDMITLSSENIKDNIQEHNWPETAMKINICDTFDNFFKEELIPLELMPKDMSRFADNYYALVIAHISKVEKSKRNDELFRIMALVKVEFLKLKDNFPMSLSLFQLCFGIIIKLNFIDQNSVNKQWFLVNEIFELLFPECKHIKINNFNLNN